MKFPFPFTAQKFVEITKLQIETHILRRNKEKFNLKMKHQRSN